jgi:hypothetical protein
MIPREAREPDTYLDLTLWGQSQQEPKDEVVVSMVQVVSMVSPFSQYANQSGFDLTSKAAKS